MAAEAEGDVDDAEGGEAVAKKRGIPRRLLIIGAAALIVMLAAGAGLYFFVFAGHGAPDGRACAACEAQGRAAEVRSRPSLGPGIACICPVFRLRTPPSGSPG